MVEPLSQNRLYITKSKSSNFSEKSAKRLRNAVFLAFIVVFSFSLVSAEKNCFTERNEYEGLKSKATSCYELFNPYLVGGYVELTCKGDKQYIGNSIDCDSNGCDGEEIPLNYKYYFKEGENPKFYVRCWSNTEELRCTNPSEFGCLGYSDLYTYSWAGWDFPQIITQVCSEGSSKCLANNYLKCEPSDLLLGSSNTPRLSWVNKGSVKGQCGVSCSPLGEETCNGYNLSVCENYVSINKGVVYGKCGYTLSNMLQIKLDEYLSYIRSKIQYFYHDYLGYASFTKVDEFGVVSNSSSQGGIDEEA